MGIKGRSGSPMNPEFLKLGLALAFSIGGIVLTFLRSRRIDPSDPNPSQPSPEENDDVKLMKDNNQSPVDCSSPNCLHDLSSGDKDGFLFPEFDLLLSEFSVGDDVSSGNDSLCLGHDAEEGRKDDEKLIKCLEDKIVFLEDRERLLEKQLVELYGLKEQEAIMKELQDRIRIHNVEAKVYQLKIESLEEDNRRLEAKVADYPKLVMELEEAKPMLKLLRKKLRSEAERNRELILRLQERVMMLREKEEMEEDRSNDLNVEMKETRKLEELEEMKKANENLKMENSELALKLEKLQTLATSSLDNGEIEEPETENQRLHQENEELSKEIEKLQTDRYADVEELVYLRWVNACLRYELRHYQPDPGKTAARDLGRTLSPKSEEKAKQLILEYASKEGSGANKMMTFDDLDFSQWSPDESNSAEVLPGKQSSSSKTKVFAKLLKIWREKDGQHHTDTNAPKETSRGSSLPSPRSSFHVHGSDSGCRMSSTSGESSSCCHEDGGSSIIYRKINTIGGKNEVEPQDPVKYDLIKYAEALEISHRNPPPFRRRSSEFSSFLLLE